MQYLATQPELTSLSEPPMAERPADHERPESRWPSFRSKLTTLYLADCLEWIDEQASNTYHGVVTDPPYGMIEYTEEHLAKRKAGHGGVWRIPPAIGGSVRQPLPRFTVLEENDLEGIYKFFLHWGDNLCRVLVPGAHVLIASNPLVSDIVASAMRRAGYEKRGEIMRVVRTLRGGDRPKGAEEEFPEISAMPRSNYEPWLLFRKPFDGTLANNLRTWKAGALRRPTTYEPFPDLLVSVRTPKKEREVAPHPSLKPQGFLRHVVRAMLPTGDGVLLDTFAGSGSTLAAAEAIGYRCVGMEIREEYFEMARKAILRLAEIPAELQNHLLRSEVDSSTA